MKVLYIGCYRDGTGWAHAAQDYILSLDTVNIEVVPRFVKLNDNFAEIPKRIEDLENNDDKNCDVVIQHVLPHLMDYRGDFQKNIALYVTETDHCKNTCWPERISMLDESWVPNKFMAGECSINSNILNPHYIVPHAADVSKYQTSYEPLDIPYIQDKFVFYYIGEINRRKNIPAILRAFHTEFGPEEDVAIVIKAHVPGQSAEQSQSDLINLSNRVKDGLKIYGDQGMYHSEIFITDYLSEEQIMRLHSTCDCFVSATLGEAWGIPIFDAMAMGKTPICTDTGGPRDFIGDGGYLVNSRKEPCFGMVETFDELYVSNESWDAPDLLELRGHMRSAFENKEEREKKIESGISRSYDYSYSSVGDIMKSILLEENNPEPFNKNSEIKEIHSLKKILQCQT